MNLNRILKQPPRSREELSGEQQENDEFLGLLPRRAAVAPLETPDEPSAQSLLTVGRGIEVAGEIGACDILMVEGKVNAAVTTQHLEVRAGGLFQGVAQVETARIEGAVDGNLVVRGLLTIPAGGRAAGRIRYGELAIEPGGQIAGDIDVSEESAALVTDEEAVA